MAFEIPTDAGEIQSLVSTVKGEFQKRDERMKDDQDVLEMRGGGTGTLADVNDNAVVTLNDGLVIWHKMAAMCASAEEIIKATARSFGEEPLAQKIENFLWWWWDTADDYYAQGLHGGLKQDEFGMAMARGWLCSRLMMDPTRPEFPWSYTPVDPITVYPRLAGGKMLWVAQSYRPTVAEVLGDWGDEADTMFADADEQDRVDFVAMYTDTEMAVVANGEFLKNPEQHGYGFNPLICTLANGAPYRATEFRDDFQAYVGTGVLQSIRGPLRDKEDLATMLKVWMAKTAEPPVVLKTDDEDKFNEIDTRSGGRMVIGQKDDIAPLLLGANPQSIMPLMQLVQDEVNRGALGAASFGDTANFASGYHAAVAAAGSRHMVFPYVRAFERHRRLVSRNVLKLFTTQPLPSVGFMSGIGSGSVQNRTWQVLQPQEVMQADVEVTYELKDVTPQDEMQKAQIGFQALDKQVLDPDTVRDRYFDVKNPEDMNIKVLASMALQNPMLVQTLSMAAMMMSNNPFLLQGLQQMQQMQGPQGQPGQPPPGLPNPMAEQPPMAQPSVPNNVLPDEMGQSAGLAPNDSPMGGPTSSGTVNQARLPGT